MIRFTRIATYIYISSNYDGSVTKDGGKWSAVLCHVYRKEVILMVPQVIKHTFNYPKITS